MSERQAGERPREENETTVGGMPGDLLEGTDVGEARGEDRTYPSGETPTGGIPTGGDTSRVQPDRTIPRSATNVPPSDDIGIGDTAGEPKR